MNSLNDCGHALFNEKLKSHASIIYSSLISFERRAANLDGSPLIGSATWV